MKEVFSFSIATYVIDPFRMCIICVLLPELVKFLYNLTFKRCRNMSHTVQNTLAMAIGKFNFASLKEASEFAAWIFFAFSSKI